MSNNKTFLSQIADADINATLQHYGKMIGVDIVQEIIQGEGAADFTLIHDDDCLMIIDANAVQMRRLKLPIALSELGEVLLELQSHVPQELLLNQTYMLDVQRRALLHQGRVVCELTEKESEMLRYIAMAGALGADKDELLQHVWGYNAAAKSRTIEAHLYRLRQKLQEIGEGAPAINVVDGSCYLVK